MMTVIGLPSVPAENSQELHIFYLKKIVYSKYHWTMTCKTH